MFDERVSSVCVLVDVVRQFLVVRQPMEYDARASVFSAVSQQNINRFQIFEFGVQPSLIAANDAELVVIVQRLPTGTL